MSGEQDPAFWRKLYRAPTETEDDLESTGFHVAISAEDLVAERVGANDGSKPAESAAASIDQAAVKAIVNGLLKKRLAEMAAKGMLVAPGSTAAVGERGGPRRPASPSDQSTTAVAAPSGAAGLTEDPVDHASTAIEDSLPPWQEAPEVDAGVGLDTQASTLTIDDADVDLESGEDDEDFFVEVDEDVEDDFFVEVEEDEDDLVVEMDDEEDEGGGDVAGLWKKVPILPGGQSSLIGVSGLSPTAPMVLVLIDGVSTLKGLKMLVPHVPDDEFEAIIKDGIARGLVVFD